MVKLVRYVVQGCPGQRVPLRPRPPDVPDTRASVLQGNKITLILPESRMLRELMF